MLSDATQQITLDMFRRYSDSPQGQSVFASAVYVIEAAGWSLGPFLGANSTAANRDSVRAEYASNRRHVAMMERQLYTALNTHGINLPGPADENLWGNEILDARQDQALFNWLHNHNAFAGFRLNEEFRKESFGPRSGRVRTNAEIWDMLRDLGCWLTIHPDYTGHWYKADQPLYTPEEEELTDTFQELLSEGAFATRGIMQEFAGRDEYYIFRRALEMRISWNINHGVWTHRGGPPLFGDQPRTPEQRQNDLLSQVRDGTAGIVLQERQITLPRRPPTPALSQAPIPVPDEDIV